MKISELIAELERQRAAYGDLEIVMLDENFFACSEIVLEAPTVWAYYDADGHSHKGVAIELR